MALSLSASSGSSACCTMTCALESPTLSVIISSMRSMPFVLLLGRATGVVSPTLGKCATIGFTFSTDPAQAAALAMRPVLAR